MEQSAADYWKNFWTKRANTIDNPYVLAQWASNNDDFDQNVFNIILRSIVERLALSPSDNLLDVGCGNGILLDRLKDFVGNAVGVDFSQKMIARFKITHSIHAMVGESAFLPFMDNTFTKVSVYGLFQFFPSEEYARQALQELYRVCKPNGRILISSVPSPDEARWVRNRSLFRWKRFAYPVMMPVFDWLMSRSLMPKWIASFILTNHYFPLEFFSNILANQNVSVEFFDERDIPGNTWSLRYDVLMTLPISKQSLLMG